MPKVKSLKIALQTGTDNTYFATWDCTATNIDHYRVYWYYATGDGEWFSSGSAEDVTRKQALYTPPSNAYKFKVSVKPVSKTYKVQTTDGGTKDKSYWSGTYVSEEYIIDKYINLRPDRPSAPTVTIDKYKLTAVLDNIEDDKAVQIEFYIVNGTSKFESGVASIKTKRATFSCNVTAGGKYRVCCRAINVYGKTNVKSEWSIYSPEVTTIPTVPTNVKCAADSETSVKVTWAKVSTATSYEVEYTTDTKYFDTSSSNVSSVTVDGTTALITGLESGKKWYFRVRSANTQGESGWSSAVSTIIGSKPAAPTTWSLSTTAMVGEDVVLYWVHNTEDGSKQTKAQVQYSIDGVTTTKTITTNSDDDDENEIHSFTISNTSAYTEGAEIEWRVRTMGVTSVYGDWSTMRTIDLYAPPTLELHLGRYLDHKWVWDSFNFETDTIYTAYEAEMLECLPYKIVATAGPSTQAPVSYHISVIALESYDTEDSIGNTIRISEGAEVYSKSYHTSDNPLEVEISAGDITLENNQTYKVLVTVAMNSGLTAEASGEFTVSWADDTYEPNAGIAIDKNNLTAYISPFCEDENGKLIEDVVLSVYRREYDGRFTEIASNLVNDGSITVTDPHPALDYARYRIVARCIDTSVVGYEDLPGEPVGEPSIVIQWGEQWTKFDYAGDDTFVTPTWTGSMIRLKGNVDISENHAPDTSLINYIGRSNPVGYYGTYRGEGGSWSAAIPKSDKETLYALRRLAAYMGDVYVREPSGIGYWAQITVSLSQTHRELTIPVTFDIKRVEGGM